MNPYFAFHAKMIVSAGIGNYDAQLAIDGECEYIIKWRLHPFSPKWDIPAVKGNYRIRKGPHRKMISWL